ncbi:unnamed protein product [Cladocopium goreaui]|uniref:DUF21 domain-containing protein At1g47330 (CBS domain-containing protein CBSDUF7) n=1 Tax=Cladocopium goreaui TaxID=2562237 RepID=A0A9P1FFK1_9DINO|nr:unnamed protein product [Cladocopium goreaui]
MATMQIWLDVISVLICVLSAALAAGLTLGLATLEPFGLQVILASRPEDCLTSEERQRLRLEQQCASRILPLVKDHHLLLVTLLLFNTVANEADRFRSDLLASLFDVSPLGDADPEVPSGEPDFCMKGGLIEEAIREFHSVCNRVPRNAVARTNLGSAYFERGDEDAALHWFRYAYRGWADAPEVVVLLEESEMEAYPSTPKSSKSLLLINGKKQCWVPVF